MGNRPVRPERTFPVLVVIPARVEGPLVAKIHAQVGHRLLIIAVGGGLKITSVSGSKTNWNVALPKSSFLQNRTSVWVKMDRLWRLHAPSRFLHKKYVHRALTLIFLLTVTMTMSAQWPAQQDEGGIPAYNAGPPPKGTKLPAILTKADLWGADAQYPYQTHAYELASKIPTVLHQQPCYCYCDRMGHNSLHSCFEGTHGARCSTCLKELYYSYQQHQKGKTATQIRAGIIKGDWKRSTWIRLPRLTSG